MNRIRSLAIAGAWGYIGRKFVAAGLDLGLEVAVFDPGPAPPDLPLARLRRCADEAAFYGHRADLFHLALHPEHRGPALAALLRRAAHEPVAILDEKPMAAPERPQDCADLIDAVTASGAVLLFDFPELFDPLTQRVLDFLAGFGRVEIDQIASERSKDREDRAAPRNRKRMVHIQYQESVHCLAWVLFVLGRLRGGPQGALAQGVRVDARARPYDPPNPEAYPYVVDGCVDYEMALGGTVVRGRTDFKRGAPWRKRRVVRGRGDGRPFEIDVDYLEGRKYLRLDGVDAGVDPEDSSYTGVLATFDRWLGAAPAAQLMSSGLYPDPAFARLTYQLSSLLWRSSYDGRALAVRDAADLLAFDARFAAAVPTFGRCGA